MVGIYNNLRANPRQMERALLSPEPPEMTLQEFNRLQAEQLGVNMQRQPMRDTGQLPARQPEPPPVLKRPKQNIDLVTPFSAPEDVAEVQRMLTLAGFDPGKIDGKFGKRTRAAVKEFQRINGLKVDGKVGVVTLGKLSSAIPYQAPNYQAGQAWQAQYPGNETLAQFEGGTARLPRARPGPGLRG